jgi:hypothetical protein
MYLTFFRMYTNDLKECCEKFLDLDRRISNHYLLYGEAVQCFIIGLASFQLYRETNNPLWAERGRKRKNDMKTWAKEGSSWNFEHKLLLLEAEDEYSSGNLDCAKELYKNAIATAQAHKFVNDEALACELTAKFYQEIGDLPSSLNHYRLAHEKYCQWGAAAKAANLFAYINETFAGAVGRT